MATAHIWQKAVVTFLLGLLLAVSAVTLTPTSAEASVNYCGDGRCTIYFSQSETRAIAQGRVPAASGLPGPLAASYYALAYGHRWFAQQYANRGWCSAFRLSVYPWESQGYYGYACNWR